MYVCVYVIVCVCVCLCVESYFRHIFDDLTEGVEGTVHHIRVLVTQHRGQVAQQLLPALGPRRVRLHLSGEVMLCDAASVP